MLHIPCPFCGPRDETEFSCGGEAHILRPLAQNKISDTAFAEYLFLRDNSKGVFWSAGAILPVVAVGLMSCVIQ